MTDQPPDKDPETAAIVSKVYQLFQQGGQARKPPDILYHYTDSGGLMGIVESGIIRATHVTFMNDATEYMHAVELLRGKVVKAQKQQEGIHEAALLADMEMNLIATRPANFYPQFVACFSGQVNSLSQWRAYGRGEGAFAIGFDAAQLAEAAARTNVLFCHVTYDVDQQSKLVQDLLDWAITEYPKLANAQPANTRDEHRRRWVAKLFQFAAQIAPVMKNPNFKEENEWRLISPLIPLGKVGFVPKPAGLVPFAKLRMGKGQLPDQVPNPEHVQPLPDLLPIKVVWSGPGRFNEISLMAAQGLFRQCNYANVEFKTSTIPFRVT